MIRINDRVILLDAKGNKILVQVTEQPQRIKNLGVYTTSALVGLPYGTETEIGGRTYRLLKPSVADLLGTIQRKPQVIKLKDAALIAVYCDVKCGTRVVEGGIGSGALAIVLANLVKPHGKVITYELRNDFARLARANLEFVGLEDFVEIKLGDITSGIEEKNVDLVVLDIPNPWEAVEHAFTALKSCGYFCSYTPTINQVEKTVRILRNYNFIEIRTIETLERELIVGDRGVRPSFEMLGHTGYLTFARKLYGNTDTQDE
jgi:tRNA (adenine57-N1/adenine58-N1)-methyltransferase